jgi:hypothetical protein
VNRALLASLATIACSACTIDPVARAELTGAVTGEALFQGAGTTSQVSYRVDVHGPDGAYVVDIADGDCTEPRPWMALVDIAMAGGTATVRGVTSEWAVTDGDDGILGRVLVVAGADDTRGCGEITESD